jgi:antitoxin ParD1/3/4
VRESLCLLNTHDALQQQRIAQLNQAIDVGINQLRQRQRVEGAASYEKMKRKIDKIAAKGK